MIKLLILLLLVIILIFVLKKLKKENFHEKTNKVEDSKSEVLENCESCSFCDFNPNPETKDYIISRCLFQHTLTSSDSPEYKPSAKGCRNHKDLSSLSGCVDAIRHFKTNIDNLKNVNVQNANCRCNYSLDGLPIDNSPEKQSYNSWLKTLNQ